MMERDTETGLDPTMFRILSSTQGRWLSPDPLAGDVTNPQSLNRYAYVLNNPINLTDVLGLGSPYGPTAPPCNGPGQISCTQYFSPIGPASGPCPAQFSSCYATLGGSTIGIQGSNATAFTFGTPLNTVGQPCNAAVIAAGECAGWISGINVVATGTVAVNAPFVPVFTPSGPAPNKTTIQAANGTFKPNVPPKWDYCSSYRDGTGGGEMLYQICVNTPNGPWPNCVRGMLLNQWTPNPNPFQLVWYLGPDHAYDFTTCAVGKP
jgi:RHS repeat-associated protein